MPELQRLRADHAPAVLAFELANRAYFATFISDRGDEFFDHFAARHGLRTLKAVTTRENVASQKVLTKAGFVPTGPAEIAGKPGTWYQRDLPTA